MNADQIRGIVEASPVADRVDRIMDLATPAVKMKSYLVESGELPKGTSRLGGSPDLPPDAAWPENRGRPIEFLAQINFGDAMQVETIPGMPTTGWLLLFHDFQGSFDGRRDDPHLWQVMHFDGAADELQRVDQPVEPAADFNFCELAFERELCLPGDFIERVGHDDEDGEAWEYFDETLWDIGSGPYHRIGGFPMLIQSDLGDYREYDFLLQIDSDDEFGWMWGDCGRVHCWTRRKGLLARVAGRSDAGGVPAWADREFACGDEFY